MNAVEAERVREIFRIADQTGSLAVTLQRMNARGLATKDWTTRKGVHHVGRPPFPKMILRALLGNVPYIKDPSATREDGVSGGAGTALAGGAVMGASK